VIVLCALFLVGIGVVAYQFLRTSGPRQAAASPASSNAASPAGNHPGGASEIDAAIQELDGSAGGEQQDAFTVVRVEHLVKEFDTYVQSRQVPLAGLRVNPFQVTKAEPSLESTTQKGAPKVPEVNEEEARKEKLRAAAAGLKVGSILVSGQSRLVVLNGNVYRVGDKVEGFSVDAIEANRVVLSAEEMSFELRLFDDAPALSGSKGQ